MGCWLSFPPSEVFIFFAMEGPRHQNGVGQEYRVQQRGRGNEATMVFDVKKLAIVLAMDASGHFRDEPTIWQTKSD